MARKKVHRSLPKLVRLHPSFSGFPQERSDLHGLTEALRKTIARVRQDDAHPFYTQRELAQYFKVPLRTVNLACKKLAAEGLLFSRRGGMTMVAGRKLAPRVPARGVVGLPIQIGVFVGLQWWRSFFVFLEEELRKRNFVADWVYYRERETFAPELADRLVAHHLDYLVWLLPLPRSRQTLEWLADGGVRVLAVVDQAQLPPTIVQYVTSWEKAYYRALRGWRQDGITSVILVGARTFLETPRHGVLKALDRLGMPYKIQTVDNPASLPRDPRTGIVIADDFAQADLSRRHPSAMIQLLCECRVMLANALELRDAPPDVHVDIVRIEWEKLARRLAEDIAGLEHQPRRPPVTVFARLFARVPANRFAEEL